ncbi:hypothetical protein CIHG_06564 [Coccidioides immitis H538.4]|uniref:Uncharacterized protein n=3 Tax=Coccidioides immitis TaxID=5501 RepID=A0A0J8QJ77_COCIT|nr:hypothetical protein CIRG_07978 [Coccidioides immitis RMSCC 2394]KMU72444.1 hypothetical protein CISG_03092 [Coccidioides immitis RMSCC 3703]KMU88626.1 hypothetical protein CIHG_06564 [Coccidioides immitis H538.4]
MTLVNKSWSISEEIKKQSGPLPVREKLFEIASQEQNHTGFFPYYGSTLTAYHLIFNLKAGYLKWLFEPTAMLEELSNANARRPKEDLHGSSGNIGAKDQEDFCSTPPRRRFELRGNSTHKASLRLLKQKRSVQYQKESQTRLSRKLDTTKGIQMHDIRN